MTRGAVRVVLAAIAVALAAGCSGGSSSPTGAGRAPTSTNTTGGPDELIDRATVDTSLAKVLVGLRALTSEPAGATPAVAAAGLRTAAADLKAAGELLDPAPEGVPAATAAPVATGLLSISALMTDTVNCLAAQQQTAHPSQAACVKPLRKADSATNSLATALISLAAYSSESPDTFETDLVAAVRGK